MSTLRRLVSTAGIGIALTGFGAAAASAEPAPRAQTVRPSSQAPSRRRRSIGPCSIGIA